MPAPAANVESGGSPNTLVTPNMGQGVPPGWFGGATG